MISNYRKALPAFVLVVAFSISRAAAQQPTPDSVIYRKIDAQIKQMTLEEKVGLLHANSSFTSGGVARLGIPELVTSDGPHGVRMEHGRDWRTDNDHVDDSATYLPTGVCLASTWNPQLGYAYGAVLGSEANARGKDVILGPGINIIRSPLNGRNFEYQSEDPYLVSRMAVGYIKGVQDQDVSACVKHFLANNQETCRGQVNVLMSERALREIYLPGFKAAVEQGGVYSVMGAYNKFRGQWCTENEYLVNDLLKGEFGFKGLLMSDWGAVHHTMEALWNGTDLEMGSDLMGLPYNKFLMADTVVALVKRGVVDERVIDEKVRRILYVLYKIHKFGGRKPGAFSTKEHFETARRVAEEGIVLLKNSGLLPLSRPAVGSVAVIGANAVRPQSEGGGSSQVRTRYEVTPLEGIKRIGGGGLRVTYAPGYVIARNATADPALIDSAVAAAKKADVAVIVGGWTHGYNNYGWEDKAYDAEGVDKPDMTLPFGQDSLLAAVVKANPRTVVVLMGGGPVDMTRWINATPAVVQAWYPGSEGGTALAEILFGLVNPSGKLPMTFPETLAQSPAHVLGQFPGDSTTVEYDDDIFVGYRYFDTWKVKPQFAFGHGLSYTTFRYADLSVTMQGPTAVVSLSLTNTGHQPGAEVVQVYVKQNRCTLRRPEKELKGFEKVMLQPGETRKITITLPKDAFQYYDDTKHAWVLDPGTFTILCGSASDDIRASRVVSLGHPATVALNDGVSLPNVFGDNMVLQRNIPIPIWGKASPGAIVTAGLGKMTATAKADQRGKWMLHFPKLPAGGPYVLSVGEEGRPESRVEFKNVLIGDVWLASGQSNMEFQVQQAKNAASEISSASYPDIRLLIVDHDKQLTPQTDIHTAGWKMADSNSVKQFSAVAFFFARKIHAGQHVPIGLIQSTWGGTPVQAWTSREKLLASPITKDAALANDTLTENNFLQDSLNQGRFWDIVNRPQGNADTRIPMPGYNDSGWKKVEMPRLIKDFGIGWYEGIMWLRKKLVLPDAFAGRSLTLDIGHPEMCYSLYFNGVEICKSVWNGAPRQTYPIPAAIVRKGENTIAIRMAMLWGGGGLNPPAEDLYLTDGDTHLSLAGEWLYKGDLEPLPPIHNYQYYPDVLFNGMINPLIPYGITGFLWYQGEANDTEAYNYRKMFPAMIRDWRQRWQRGDLPFLFVQLANFKSRKPLPAESEWAELREAQAMALSEPQTAMACAIDLGEAGNIHPTDKQDVGLRLARCAEKMVYKQPVIASGPTYKEYTIQGDRIRVRFASVGSGLRTSDGKPITGFAIAGEDRRFYWADAAIEGNEIIVHSDKVSAPRAVRYAWADNPACNLENAEGLPAVPFRTDKWRGITQRDLAQRVAVGAPVVSPNGVLSATVGLDERGQLYYSVSYGKEGIVSRGDLGISRSDADFTGGLVFAGVVGERKVVDAYRMMHGKRRDCHNAATEKVFRFRNSSGVSVDVVFRAYDDGVALRYVFPGAGGDSGRVTGERTSFVIPEGTERWIQQYTSAYEGLYPSSTTGKADAPDHQQWGFPALYKVQDKPVYVLISEAGVTRDNCASRLSNREEETVYRVTMPEDAIPAGRGWKSAWRVLMIGSLADIVRSTLITDVSEPSQLTDTGWIRPGSVAWVYWAFNHGSKDYKKIVEYVDLAVAMHWPYVLIDWEWDRMTNGGTIEDAVAYARSKGIKPLMWYNSRDSLNSSVGLDPYGRLSTPAARRREFAWLNKIGVYGVKVDFFEDDRQKEMAYYLDLLEDAAKYHLLVDFHGATLPKGWARTYPNLMTMEAVYGAEWYGYAPVLTKLGAAHNATLPFTRNVVGPMDYTPVTFTNIGFPHTTTYAHELALSVVFESGLQHFADRPEGFYALPDAERQFLMTVPVAWDDTRLIDGFPGKRVEIARRKGGVWYIGGLNGEDQPQTLQLHFDFLTSGRYTLELIRDGATGKEFTTQTIVVRKGSTVEVNCLPRGGFVATLRPS